MRSTKLGCFRLCFLVSLESSQQGGVHGLGSMTFGLVVQKFLHIWECGNTWGLTIQFKHDFLSYLTVQKINTYIAKQCSHVEFPYFVMGSHLGQQHRLHYWELTPRQPRVYFCHGPRAPCLGPQATYRNPCSLCYLKVGFSNYFLLCLLTSAKFGLFILWVIARIYVLDKNWKTKPWEVYLENLLFWGRHNKKGFFLKLSFCILIIAYCKSAWCMVSV